ncbi:hypothetical protein HMN09_00922500 [Mycena chlorophos]|uniref:Uncharacterized protein n=2 Tax=Mycena chlorophos TaxID=658473 RepID=A0ABQ0LTC8_MYCCL|nr:hypothetical protein HMN09_00922500 [Mycena chlorophos]GAT54316.1 predicted protein [Mycena chlorophos]
MAPLASLFVSFVLALSAVSAPTPNRRQIGDLGCNLARLQIIKDIGTARDLISSIQGQNGTSDLPTSISLAASQTALTSVQSAIQDILDNVLINNPAPEITRGQVVGGVESALTALNQAASTISDSNLNSTLAQALSVVQFSRGDAKGVITNCTVSSNSTSS